jgi:hypothetical protein
LVVLVLANHVMTSSIALSTRCAFTVALISGVSEICQFVYLPEPRSKLISLLTVAAASFFTFVVTFLLAGRKRLKCTYDARPNDYDVPETDQIAERTLTRVILATEHVASLLLVFRIAREYKQPISGGALHNLKLVEKDLRGLQTELEDHLTARGRPNHRPQPDNSGRFEAPAVPVLRSSIDHATKL